MEAALVTLKPGEKTEPMKPFQGEAFGFVLAGQISLRLGTDKHKASKGHSFYFSGDREHVISNEGERTAEFLWVTTPPTF
jgi:quercetin dioxygenase-like cupin family protein